MFIERHYTFSVSTYEGLWHMTFMNPENRQEAVSVYIEAPNSDYLPEDYADFPIITPGPRLTEVLNHLLYRIESYPYSWDFSNKKIVSYGYDFESNYNGSSLTTIDLTEIAHKEIVEYYNFFSPLQPDTPEEGETVSGKGVMSKIAISFNETKSINHLSLDYFAEYPIELLSLMYQVKEDGPLTELPLQKAVSTNHSLILHFPTVLAKRFILIIKQETYTFENSTSSSGSAQAAATWNYASAASQALYEQTAGEYLDWIMPTASGIQLHQEILESNKQINKGFTSGSTSDMNPYGEEFAAAKKRLDSEQR